jgi:hypothetical protein
MLPHNYEGELFQTSLVKRKTENLYFILSKEISLKRSDPHLQGHHIGEGLYAVTENDMKSPQHHTG